MPPIFGILSTRLQRIDPAMIGRMKEAAVYIKPREIVTRDMPGGLMAAAVVTENPLVPGVEVLDQIGPWVIVADVSLYKREKLLEKIGDKGQGTRDKRQGTGDGEKNRDARIILEAWLKWGGECVQYLYGDFAFVIFNVETGEVFCGRDHLGVRPFFYTLHNGTFIFASELRLVVAALPEKPPVRLEYLLDTLVTVKTEKNLTPFENIFRLNQAHFLHGSGGVINTGEYWTLDPEKAIRLNREEDYLTLFREKLVNAVTMRCNGVSKPGAELSGGLDSSAITGIAADYVNRNGLQLTAFSNIFPAETGIDFKDEREFISAMRDFISFDWVGIDRHNQSLPTLLQHTIDKQGCYVQQNFNIFERTLFETAGETGTQVLFSGFGGDELVSARISIPWFELIHDREWRTISDELYYNGISLKSLLKPGLLAYRYMKSGIASSRYTSGVFTPELLDRRFANIPLQPAFAVKHSLRKRQGDQYRKMRRTKTSWKQFDRIMLDHVPQRMEYCYTAAAQYGLEYRYPLFDIDLVETALAFPPWVKQHHGMNRYIFRQAIKDFVPETIWKRDDKSGSTIPQTYYSLVNEKEEILKVVRNARDLEFLNEIFDLSRFAEWYEKLVKRDPKDMNYLMPGAFYDYLMILMYYGD